MSILAALAYFLFLVTLFPIYAGQFCVTGGVSARQRDEVYLNLVLEYIPETVYKVSRHYNRSKQTIPISFIKVTRVPAQGNPRA